ncbi:MAG: Inositol-1(Or 4)-monophosphatase [Candidatus Magasanikbacteria bacterium GW2011_GWC2_37_14]|uniref:Inositol-1-monophosphatase n=1 Tax=Candidatus Magasanikbacteria bacterium GW2011_GWC2_37_14 TaxID=1619046 RepID=A0A0G0GN05_9BACT|nr:MAG: Inositol-1(Or 4)-monophosphatase [Candidatus Magasanikbacteria bacterium GW2011_GWC2_37_14]
MKNELLIATKIVKETNQLLHKHFQRSGARKIKFKKDDEIVTSIDLLSNRHITTQLLKNFSTYDIVSEEAKKIDNPSTKTWHVDPLDGTTNFAYGYPEFATCLGLEDKDEITVGVIGLPMMNEIYYAQIYKGAWCNGQKIKVSKISQLKNSMFLICRGHSPAGRRRFHKFLNKLLTKDVGHFRQFSCAGIELSAVASGHAEACVMANIHPWDVIAGIRIILEAGGKVTNWQGQPWQMSDDTMLASNGLIHNEIVKMTKGIK